jgi:hypothetical protein
MFDTLTTEEKVLGGGLLLGLGLLAFVKPARNAVGLADREQSFKTSFSRNSFKRKNRQNTTVKRKPYIRYEIGNINNNGKFEVWKHSQDKNKIMEMFKNYDYKDSNVKVRRARQSAMGGKTFFTFI